jgi:hypothetical protein
MGVLRLLVFFLSLVYDKAEMPAFILLFFFALSSGVVAQESSPAQYSRGAQQRRPPVLEEDPSSLLGMDLNAASALFGFPEAVYAVRGDEPWQDDVVFKYSEGYSFFWFRDRVWQIRFDGNYRGPVFGLFKGNGKDKALSLLGTPLFQTEDSLVFELPDRGYPVRLRVVFAAAKGANSGGTAGNGPPGAGPEGDTAAGTPEGFASDFYLYRADF